MCLPAAVSAGLCLAGPRLARRLPPATAVPLLTLASLLTALSTGFVLAVAAFLVLAQVPAVALLGHWSAAALAAMEPVPVAAGLAAGAMVLTLLASAARRGAAAGRDLALARRHLSPSGIGGGGPGRRGRHRTRRVRRARARWARGRVHRDAAGPAGAERRVLLAHEAAHLRHHHHLSRPARGARRCGQPAAAPTGDRGARRESSGGPTRPPPPRSAGPGARRPDAGAAGLARAHAAREPGAARRRRSARSTPPWPSAPARCWHRGRPGVGCWPPPWSR